MSAGASAATMSPEARAAMNEHKAALMRALEADPSLSIGHEEAGKLPGLGDVDAKGFVAVMNELLTEGKVQLMQTKDNAMQVKLLNRPLFAGQVELDVHDRLVLQTIGDGKNKGVWLKDLKSRTNIASPTIKKILKTLLKHHLIKEVKSVASARKKVYMLYDVEPDASLTGGAWYADQEFDIEFVDQLSNVVIDFLRKQVADATKKYATQKDVSEDKLSPSELYMCGFVSAEEVLQYINEVGVTNETLRPAEVGQILVTLCLEGVAEERTVPFHPQCDLLKWHSLPSGQKVYRAIHDARPVNNQTHVPCTLCPVAALCREGGEYSPDTCQYMRDWLQF